MDDLTGGPDERIRQLTAHGDTEFDAAWLRRQLDLAFEAWGAAETSLDIEKDSHADY
jgi:hypothetical protein